jgi:hypothetical protein
MLADLDRVPARQPSIWAERAVSRLLPVGRGFDQPLGSA